MDAAKTIDVASAKVVYLAAKKAASAATAAERVAFRAAQEARDKATAAYDASHAAMRLEAEAAAPLQWIPVDSSFSIQDPGCVRFGDVRPCQTDAGVRFMWGSSSRRPAGPFTLDELVAHYRTHYKHESTENPLSVLFWNHGEHKDLSLEAVLDQRFAKAEAADWCARVPAAARPYESLSPRRCRTCYVKTAEQQCGLCAADE